MAPLVAFIIGAGKNIGDHTAAALKGKGYKIALGSRNPDFEQVKKDGYFPVAVDAANTESVKAAFATVNKELGPPNAVVFNAAARILPPVSEDPLTLSFEDFKQQTDIGVNVYVAAQEAVKGFRSDIHKDTPLKTFIVTGNPLPWVHADLPGPQLVGITVEKDIQWRLMEILSGAYSKEARFYFVSLVGKAGGVVDSIPDFFTSGPQHSQVYSDLITREDRLGFEYRFTLDGKKFTK
ncbi:hypothetical protein R3P38DRAFT_2878352 [Favolaschia claudopus]|uniref:Uncharacterized protein n=1 Tax=Favolaschia claudopus TaxID=2862362 RepID=A0AAW0D0K7_9AGAR